jgi:catechol 2,3-dioxygenase-like lactoylglutathione lyase family enzyme
MGIPSGSETARPFLPTKDFEASKAFYEALGFRKILDSDVAIFAIGQTSFILHRPLAEGAAENFMMQLMVDDLDGWWAHVESLDLRSRFDLAMLKAPETQSWGLRVAYIADPAGVLWHIAQRRDGKAHDR